MSEPASHHLTQLAAAPGEAIARNQLAAVMAIGAAMATTRDYTQMLAQVIDAVCAIVDASSGGFMRYDEQHGELVLQAPAFGVHAEHVVSRYRVALADGGNAARVFLSRQAYVANDAQHDPRFIQRFVRLFDTRNTITVPLVLHERPLGIFHAINKRSGDFTPADCDVLTVVAPLLAACLQSALTVRAFEDERRQLERSLAVHARLLETAATAQGPDAVCATLHELVRRPLLLLDTLRRPMSSFAWALDPAQVALALGVVTAPDGLLWHLEVGQPTQRLAVVSIPVAGERGGYLLVAEDGRPLDAIDRKALEQAATLLALEMFKRRSRLAAETRAASALLVELFSAGLTEDGARRLLARLGSTGSGPWRVVVVRFHGGEPGAEPVVHQHGTVLREALERALGSLKREARLMHWRDGFVIVAAGGVGERLTERALMRRLQHAIDMLDSLPHPVVLHLGIGRAEPVPTTLGASLRTAEQVLAAITRLRRRPPVMRFEELGVHRLLLGANDAAEQAEFMQQVLAPVLAADAASSRGHLLHTLRVLIGRNFNFAASARELGLHLNTVKYRAQQLRDLLGADPAHGDLRLEVELALKIHELGAGH